MRLDPAALDGIDWSSGHPLSELAVVAAAVFGFGDELAHATRNSPPGTLCYLAHLEGRPAASVMACHHDGDCGIFWVATHEHARLGYEDHGAIEMWERRLSSDD